MPLLDLAIDNGSVPANLYQVMPSFAHSEDSTMRIAQSHKNGGHSKSIPKRPTSSIVKSIQTLEVEVPIENTAFLGSSLISSIQARRKKSFDLYISLAQDYYLLISTESHEVNARIGNGSAASPLHDAVMQGQSIYSIETSQHILAYDSETLLIECCKFQKVLQACVNRRNPELLSMLLDHSPRLDVVAGIWASLVQIAFRWGYRIKVDLASEKSYPFFYRLTTEIVGRIPLHLAVNSGVKMVKYLAGELKTKPGSSQPLDTNSIEIEEAFIPLEFITKTDKIGRHALWFLCGLREQGSN
ncbi:hypothetical protein DM02DRAFT_662448 [Periconia macrospinosa]|uniref:Ankyrin n=1 Tax=Periconia macrospinosa TaxID=97972 RepID=A0A2V1D4G3_9PLEO|nr:hypothetical protein DM02DRAFT_662448 [Periconia macrospinosa]